MSYTIKASEVKPGMEVEITTVRRMTINKNYAWGDSHRTLSGDNGYIARLGVDAPVTVLSEPQPEEPTEFGAKVIVDGRQFLRAPMCSGDSTPWLSDSGFKWHKWAEILAMGPVTVIPDQGWTDPDGSEATPEAHDATEPRKWDRWEDVPDMVAVRTEDEWTVVRRNGDCVERLFLDGDWARSILTVDDLNTIAPFMEVPDA